MLSRLFGIVLTVCLYGAISLGKSRAADDLGTLLTILEARAHSVSTVTWRFQSVSLKGKPFIDLLNEQGGNTNEPQGKSMDPMSIAHKRGIESLSQVVTSKTEGNVLMDLKNMKYKIGPFANEKVISFDGKLYSTIVSPELATPQNSGGRVATLPKYAEFSKQSLLSG